MIVNLQSALAAANPPGDWVLAAPHHPITCATALTFDEDGRMGCEHGRVAADDPRTRGCVDQSISILLIELLREREDGGDVPR